LFAAFTKDYQGQFRCYSLFENEFLSVQKTTPFSEGFGRRFHLKTVLDSGFSLYFSLFAVESGSLVTGSTAIS
jgi:hypothetical protein